MKKIFLSILMGLVFIGVSSFGVYVFAIPPASPYAPGATTDPNCVVGSPNCTVISPVPYSGATGMVDLGSQNFSTNGIGRFGYNTSNYSTLSTDKDGNLTILTKSSTGGGGITLNSAVVGDATILSNNGTLVLGATGATNNENLKFDFETYNNKVAVTSDSGASTLDFGTLNLTAGGLTLGQSTPGTLVTRVKAGGVVESDANGALVVDSTNGRLYFRYDSAWHYIAQTAGFQIPNYETKDPISGEEIKEGDIVLGKINQTLDDGALHGVWVKAEKALAGLGIVIRDGVTRISNLAVNKLRAKTARVNNLEMVDKATSNVYCTWIENGEWKKEKGECK